VAFPEIEENEFNLNIPRYVDTFEPEPKIEVREALQALENAEEEVDRAESTLRQVLKALAYAD
jgi:type I restriction enzyme M protein